MARVPLARAAELLLVALAVSMPAPGAMVRAQDGQAAAIVDAISGPWIRLQDRRRLSRGDLLAQDDTVRVDGSTEGTISVVALNTGRSWTKVCSTAAPCQGSFRPVAADEPAGGFWAFLSKYWTSDRELSPVLARARGAGSSGPRGGVALIRDGQIDLTTVARGVPSATYRVSMSAAPDAAAQGTAITFDVTWPEDSSHPILVKAPTPGLYLLRIRDAAGQDVGSNAVVYVTPPSPRIEAVWRDATARMGSLGLTPQAVDVLLIRVLYALDADSSNGR